MRLVLLNAVSQVPMKRLPVTWTDGMVQSLSSSDQAVSRQAVAALKARPVAKEAAAALKEPLLLIASNKKEASGFSIGRAQCAGVTVTCHATTASVRFPDRQYCSLAPTDGTQYCSRSFGALEIE